MVKKTKENKAIFFTIASRPVWFLATPGNFLRRNNGLFEIY